MTPPRRTHPRRRLLQVIRHVTPPEVLEEQDALDGLLRRSGLPAEEVAEVSAHADQLLADVSRETSEPLPALRKDQVARLEALTALWERQVRAEGPPDATLLYAAPLPPVPDRRGDEAPEPAEAVAPPLDPPPAPDLPLLEVTITADTSRAVAAFQEAKALGERAREARAADAGPPRRVSDWTSRHDPRSLEYAVRDRLRHPVPIQDLVLEHGPVLDQGTTPPLSVRDASACTGMAAVAARNVLELESSPLYTRHADQALLGAPDGLAAYHRAQNLDAVSGHAYAGTSVLAVMKAGQEAGWWDTYLWALGGTRDVAQVLLQLRAPVVVGVPWGPALEAPDAAGVLTPTGRLDQGHSLAVVGIRRTAKDGRPGPYFVLQQSRGPAEGDGGLVYLHHKHLAGLLAGRGEAAVPLPRWGLPEPTP